MFFADTHCHLNLPCFQKNLQEVVDRALESGVNRIMVPGIDLETSIKAVELANHYPCIYASVGVHPNQMDRFNPSQILDFQQLISEKKVVAVGEIGLDFYRRSDNQNEQAEVLEVMLGLAAENQKPVILHSRNSFDRLFQFVKDWVESQTSHLPAFCGVFHGFEGNADQATKVRSLPMAIGIGGPLTYKNAIEKQNMVKESGGVSLILETDAPYLSPHPFRGTENEPSRIPIIAQKMAELCKITLEEVSTITNYNSQSLFKWESMP